MSALAPADQQKLEKFLGLLGSDHAGERAAAGLKAVVNGDAPAPKLAKAK